MIERRRGTSFTAKALQGLRVTRDVLGQELQGHRATELGVFGLIHHSHATATELAGNFVVGKGLPDHRKAILGLAGRGVNSAKVVREKEHVGCDVTSFPFLRIDLCTVLRILGICTLIAYAGIRGVCRGIRVYASLAAVFGRWRVPTLSEPTRNQPGNGRFNAGHWRISEDALGRHDVVARGEEVG